MTVSTTTIKKIHSGNGIATVYAYDFRILDQTHLQVYVDSGAGFVLKSLGSDYTVAGVGASGGGDVTFISPPVSGVDNILFLRQVPLTQLADYVTNDAFPAQTHEDALDKLTMIVQQSIDSNNRALKAPASETADQVISEADWAARAGKYLAFNGSSTLILATLLPGSYTVSAYIQTLLDDADAIEARNTLGAVSGRWPLTLGGTGIDASSIAKGGLIAGSGAGTVTVKAVGSEGEAIIADPAAAGGLLYTKLGAGDVRQSVLSAVLSANGYNAAITTGAGLRPGLDASPTPMVLAIAAGFGKAGAADLVASLSADVADILGADLPVSNTSYLHATWASLSSVNWGTCLIPPQYGYAFDRTQGALLNFEGADASTSIIDDFGNTWTPAGNAQLDTAQFKFGASSLLLDGTGDYVSSSNFTTLGDGSWEMSCWFRVNAFAAPASSINLFSAENAAGFGAQVSIQNTAGSPVVRLDVSSNGTSADIVNGTGGSTVLSTATWYRLRAVFDALAGTYRLYLSNNGGAEVQELTASSTSRVCAVTNINLGSGARAGWSVFNGWIDGFRFIRAATKTGIETPSASAPTITDYPVHFFSIPAMQMYEVTAASGSAGVNPTLTARNRLFVGEADTSGVAVTAMRNYALRGETFVELAGVGASTAFTITHNLGVPRNFIHNDLMARGEQNSLYVSWSKVVGWDSASSYTFELENNALVGHDSKRTFRGVTGNGGILVNGATVTSTYRFGLRSKRAF